MVCTCMHSCGLRQIKETKAPAQHQGVVAGCIVAALRLFWTRGYVYLRRCNGGRSKLHQQLLRRCMNFLRRVVGGAASFSQTICKRGI